MPTYVDSSSSASTDSRDVQPQLAELQAQGLPGDPQQAGRPVLIALGILQHLRQQDAGPPGGASPRRGRGHRAPAARG